MSRIKQGIKRAAKRIIDDENFRDGLTTAVGAIVGILVAIIRRR